MGRIAVTPTISIDESELDERFVQASGPGGQNVNKVSSAVQLRFDIRQSPSLSEEVRQRLLKLGGSRVSSEGMLVIEARRFRSQEENRLDALRRFVTLVQKALEKPKIRKPTRPGVTAKAARLSDKKRRGELKRIRHYNPDDWE